MRVEFHPDAGAFLDVAGAYLKSDPFTTNVIAVVAARLAGGGESDAVWATVHSPAGEVVGVAMQTPPQPLFISRMPDAAVIALADTLGDAGGDLPGVNGETRSSDVFAQQWTDRMGMASSRGSTLRMYRLATLQHPSRVAGSASLARDPADVALVADWLAAFHLEAMPQAPREDWAALARRRVSAGEVHLWRDSSGPASLAAVSAPAVGVARIGPVYTPPQRRGSGSGSAVTAAASTAALNTGADAVVLYANLANPTSNAIYQAIGFRPDHDAQEHRFSPPSSL